MFIDFEIERERVQVRTLVGEEQRDRENSEQALSCMCRAHSGTRTHRP